MSTFAQEQTPSLQSNSVSPARVGRRIVGLTREGRSVPRLPHKMERQTMQRVLQTHTDELEVGLPTTASFRFAHDFSRIPVNPKSPANLQAKLKVGPPGDRYEREADQTAEQVMRMPEPGVQPACGGCGSNGKEHKLDLAQAKFPQESGSGTSVVPQAVHDVLGSTGQPLDSGTKSFFEPRFGHDFSQARIHSDAAAGASADAVGARAYTVGHDIVFASGQFSPHTTSGKRLLAHELTHVIQQRHASPVLQRQGLALGCLGLGCSTPPAPPTDIKVTQLHPIPFTAQGVAAGWLSGGGAIAEMEVSDPTGQDWAGAQIHETTTAVAETCGSSTSRNTSLCINVGQGGAAGSTWPIPDPFNGFGLSFPSKKNTFYDMHFSFIAYDVLGKHGLTSCESECEQTYDSVGGGALSPKFTIVRKLTPDNIGGQSVTQIAVTKSAKP